MYSSPLPRLVSLRQQPGPADKAIAYFQQCWPTVPGGGPARIYRHALYKHPAAPADTF